jgi:polyisoprenyl-phosphate glycosyltransferase
MGRTRPMFSLVIPVYRNEETLDCLLTELGRLQARLPQPLEVVFVVDGSPDSSAAILKSRLPACPWISQLTCLSRNFGAFNAVAAGMSHATGDFIAVMAADLQEPIELVEEFFRVLSSGEADVVLGHRLSRVDPWIPHLASNTFWWLYRRFVLPDLPPGGADVFGCSRAVRDAVVALPECNSNLIALLFWLGFRRKFVGYHRRPRRSGRSAWKLAKRLRYAVDSVFNFTDLPIRLLFLTGSLGLLFCVIFSCLVVAAKLRGAIPVPGYAPIVLTVALLGSLILVGLGVIGQYAWLCLQNARRRPNFVITSADRFDGASQALGSRSVAERELDVPGH